MTSLDRQTILRTMLDLFFIRTDEFALSYLKDDGTFGYRPSHERLEPEDIYKHMAAKSFTTSPRTIGSYAVSPEGVSRWICFDIDAHDKPLSLAREAVLKLVETLDRYNLPSYIEDSGKGFHVWIFCQDTLAYTLYFAGRYLVRQANLGLTPEVFPKQTKLEPGDMGNLVKLPLGLHYSGKRCLFLDPLTLTPLEDQYGSGGLGGFQRAHPAVLERLGYSYRELLDEQRVTSAVEKQQEESPGPPCVANMLQARLGNGEGGGRNNVLFQLTIDLQRGGLPPDMIENILWDWNDRQTEPLSKKEFDETFRHALKSTYSFGCFMPHTLPYCESGRCPVFLRQQNHELHKVAFPKTLRFTTKEAKR